MLPKDSGIEGALGRNGQSTGSGLFAAPYGLKVAMRVIAGEKVEHTTYYEGVPVTQKTVKLCKTGTAKEFAEGCNTIPPGTVPPDFAIDFWSPYTPELGFNSVLLGEPDR